MKLKRKEYIIIEKDKKFHLRIDTYILGIWLVSSFTNKKFNTYTQAKQYAENL